MRSIVIDDLVCCYGVTVCNRILSGVRIPVPQREATAGKVQPYTMAFSEYPRSGQKLQRVIVYLTGREQLGRFPYGLAEPRSHYALRHVHRPPIGLHID